MGGGGGWGGVCTGTLLGRGFGDQSLPALDLDAATGIHSLGPQRRESIWLPGTRCHLGAGLGHGRASSTGERGFPGQVTQRG